MPIKFEYDSDRNVLNLKVAGVLKSSEIIEYFGTLVEGDFLKEGFTEIVDLNKTTDFVLRYTDLSTMVDFTKKLNLIGQKVTLICAYSEVSQDIALMMRPLYQKAEFTYFICSSEKELNALIDEI